MPLLVVAGLVPTIHAFVADVSQNVDAWVKPGHDAESGTTTEPHSSFNPYASASPVAP